MHDPVSLGELVMAPNDAIPDEIVRDLQALWVPQLRALIERRKWAIRFLRAAVCIPLFLGVAAVAVALAGKGNLFNLLIFCVVALAIPAAVCNFLGKLSSCNDSLVVVEAYIYLRDRNGFIKALSKVECLGGLRGFVDDAIRITSSVRGVST